MTFWLKKIFRANQSCHSSTNPRHDKNLVNDPCKHAEKVLAIPLLLLCLFKIGE